MSFKEYLNESDLLASKKMFKGSDVGEWFLENSSEVYIKDKVFNDYWGGGLPAGELKGLNAYGAEKSVKALGGKIGMYGNPVGNYFVFNVNKKYDIIMNQKESTWFTQKVGTARS